MHLVLVYTVGAIVVSLLIEGSLTLLAKLTDKPSVVEDDPTHLNTLVHTAEMEMENYGKVMSPSVLDELQNHFNSSHFGNQTFYPPPPNPGLRTLHYGVTPPTRPSPIRAELR